MIALAQIEHKLQQLNENKAQYKILRQEIIEMAVNFGCMQDKAKENNTASDFLHGYLSGIGYIVNNKSQKDE
jgi:hypothetical protein